MVEVQEVEGPWDFIIMSIKEEDIISLEVTDEVGNVVSSREVNKKIASYNANDLPPGNYMLEITTEVGKMTKKITID